MSFAVTQTADFFKPGDKVTLGNGEEGVVKQHVVSPTGFHSYRVDVTSGSRAGGTVGATAPAMRRRGLRTAQRIEPVTVGDRTFNCRVAASPLEHQVGLQGTASLDPNEGMLFVFDHPRHATFHMGSVGFPIDIMFVENGRVARVVRSASPGTRERWGHPRTAAVIEVAAGLAPRVGARVAAPSLGRDPERYEISFPENVHDNGARTNRWKERGTPDDADPNADQMSPREFVDRAPYNPLGDSPATAPFRPSAQAISDPVDLFVGFIDSMSKEARPLDWHRNALSPKLAHAIITQKDIASWVSNFGLTGGEATDVLSAATSSEGMQVLGDGFVLSGLARIANVASTDEGEVLILWTEYEDVA
jgi:hypothetical protein